MSSAGVVKLANSQGLGLRIGGEGADAEAGGAACLLIPHRPGDVEVRPRRVADELLEEECGGDRASAPGRAEVGEVGDLGVDLLAVKVRVRVRVRVRLG